MMHPYKFLDEKHFWATAIAKRNMFDITDLWNPKFNILPDMPVATFGSCFAQHIGQALAARKFKWMVAEAAPPGMQNNSAMKFNYGVFSARTGNIYTVSLLAQWVSWALGDATPPAEIWEKDGRYYDPFRPNIEPEGFASPEELEASRGMAIEAFRTCLTRARVFVFTLGLTESWVNRAARYEYPMCPGTVAGTFDADAHEFLNQDYPFIRSTLARTIARMRQVNSRLAVLLTVSPVPLTATMSGNHVLVATMESKSILRAVAGSVAKQFPFVDYFPSYEIINAPCFRGTFFEANQRNVNHAGVDHVMDMFFACLTAKFPRPKGAAGSGAAPAPSRAEIVCEEELLGAFAGGG